MILTADLHIHSRYSMATSPQMDLPTIAVQALKKGIQLVGTGDCLHPRWLAEIKQLEEEDGFFHLTGGADGAAARFVLTVEVEDLRRVHHLLVIPTIAKAEELYEAFQPHSPDIASDGRPSLRLTGTEIAAYARDAEALIGPCHAFTPWTALYAYHNSLPACYGDMAAYLSFVELGLSADSSYADRITELRDLTFLTNSDAHSPYPIRLAREFTRFSVQGAGFEELKAAIKRERGRKPVLNVGFPPAEGKYNESACTRCYAHYSLTDAVARRWRCACGGLIKKGVRDRVNELADCDGTHPEHRPPYVHLIPLAELIGLAVEKAPNSKAVEDIWAAFLAEFGSEITVLVDTPVAAFEALRTDIPVGTLDKVVAAIQAFRDSKVYIVPGGGGKYGVIQLKPEPQGQMHEGGGVPEVDAAPVQASKRQLSLLDFS
ncbi:MAG: TIGR00375 family protein [Methanomicrobia archaeon]|nr:TIGR00375 family protein [Methanomicrobia archaeon]